MERKGEGWRTREGVGLGEGGGGGGSGRRREWGQGKEEGEGSKSMEKGNDWKKNRSRWNEEKGAGVTGRRE